MINFNIPPFTGKETEYMTKAIQNHKISGDGEFTKKCNKWIEDKTGTAKALQVWRCHFWQSGYTFLTRYPLFDHNGWLRLIVTRHIRSLYCKMTCKNLLWQYPGCPYMMVYKI